MTAAGSAASDLRAFGATDIGRRRQTNEDRFHADPARGIFIVVDGVGGHAAGDKAADTAMAAMIERLERQTGAIPDRLREAITIANNEVHRLASTRAEWRGMACVTTAVVVDGDRAFVGHVGDSRLYRLAGGRIEKMTPDHSPVGEREDAAEMSEIEAMRHPRRHEIYRDLGSEPRDSAEIGFVYLAEIALPAGAALLLCSDGLSDLVPSDQIRRVAAASAAPERVVRELIRAANEAGGKDNITAIYVERPAASERVIGAPAWRHDVSARRGRRGSVLAGMAMAALAGFATGLIVSGQGWGWPRAAGLAGLSPAATAVVRPGESIMAAVAAATTGTTVLVEPGEYRERLTLQDGVRILSRVPRGATIRLPAGAAESDMAVVAAGVTGAELSGFRIVGDAASPLGVGVIARDSSVRFMDLEITGAATAALDLGGGSGVLVSGSHVHGNPGAGLVIRAHGAPRLTHNLFEKNASVDPLAPPVVVEAGAAPDWAQNVFAGMTLQDLAGLDAALRAHLSEHNLIAAPVERPAPRAGASRRQP